MRVICKLVNTSVLSTAPRIRFKNHTQTDMIKQTLSYSFISHTESRGYFTNTHSDPLFIPLSREWPRLGSNKGVGFTSGIRGARSPLVDLCTVYLHWKPRRCETPTLRHYTNIGVICRGGFNSLQCNDWLVSLPSLREVVQWIPSASFSPLPTHQPQNKPNRCIFSIILVATEDSNSIYSAYGFTFSAETTPRDRNRSFYSEMMLVPASAVHKDLDTS